MSSLLQNSLKTLALTLLCGGAMLATAGNAAAEVTFKGKTIDVIMVKNSERVDKHMRFLREKNGLPPE